MKSVIFKCDNIITNPIKEILSSGGFLVEDGIIKETGVFCELRKKYIEKINNGTIVIKDFGNNYILPGLINCHVHLCFPGDGTSAEDYMNRYQDEIITITAVKNAQEALKAGITTLRDLGGRNNITFCVRKAIEDGIILGPRLVLSGIPITITSGHMHYLNGEVDSKLDIKKKIRQNIKNGVDCIKIICNGGGTKNTCVWKKSFEFDELEVAIKEAHRFNKPITGHVSCIEALRDCLDLHIDGLEHCDFRISQDEYKFDPELADRIAEQGIFVGKTLPSMYHTIQKMEKSIKYLTPMQLEEFSYYKNVFENSKKTFIKLHKQGVRLVASTDAGWRENPFKDFVTDLEIMTDCGLISKEALTSATILAAQALMMEEKIGSLDVSKFADFIVVTENPFQNISTLRNPKHVFIGGKEVI